MAAINLGRSLSAFEDVLLPHVVKGRLSQSGFLSTQCEQPRGTQRAGPAGPWDDQEDRCPRRGSGAKPQQADATPRQTTL